MSDESTETAGNAVKKSVGQRLLDWWMPIALVIGHFQSRVILTIFYFLIVTPYYIVMFPFTDVLRIRGKQTWVHRETTDLTLEDAKRQY